MVGLSLKGVQTVVNKKVNSGLDISRITIQIRYHDEGQNNAKEKVPSSLHQSIAGLSASHSLACFIAQLKDTEQARPNSSPVATAAFPLGSFLSASRDVLDLDTLWIR